MMLGKNRGVQRVLPYIRNGSVGVEIGVWRGDSSELFLKKAKHLHLVDPWSIEPYKASDEHGTYQDFLKRYASITGGTEDGFTRYYEKVYWEVCGRFADRHVTIHRKTSQEFFRDFDERVDWFYIDGSHSYEGCLADILNALKRSSMVFGDDYGNKPGVVKAVNQVKEAGFDVRELGDNQYGIFVEPNR